MEKFPKSRPKKARRNTPVESPYPPVTAHKEERVLHQEINLPELESILHDPR